MVDDAIALPPNLQEYAEKFWTTLNQKGCSGLTSNNGANMS